MLTLGIDVGTQSTKALLLDADAGRVVGRASKAHGLLPGLPIGAAEQHPSIWIDATSEVAHRVLADAGIHAADVRAVGVSGQQHGLCALDATGEVVRPAKLWCDTTTTDEARELTSRLGRGIPTGFTAPKILWMKRHEPALWARVRSILLPHDYVNFRLTGRLTMEAGDASGTGLFDPRMRAWDAAALAAIDERLVDMLPATLTAPGSPAGELSSEGAALLGLRPGTLVAAGSGDNMMSALGSGATRPGVAVCSLGTSGTVFVHSPSPISDPEGLIAPFCDATGGFLPLLCVMNMTGVLEEVRACFLELDLDALTSAATHAEAGCGGLLLLPYLVGERVPDLPHATGALLGLRPGLLRPGLLFRAALEGTAVSLAAGVGRLRALGIPVDSVRLTGGGARNSLWIRILSSALAAPVSVLAEPEAAALGAAIAASWTFRRVAGDPISADVLAQPFVRFVGEPVAPDDADAAVYAAMGARAADTTRRLFAGTS